MKKIIPLICLVASLFGCRAANVSFQAADIFGQNKPASVTLTLLNQPLLYGGSLAFGTPRVFPMATNVVSGVTNYSLVASNFIGGNYVCAFSGLNKLLVLTVPPNDTGTYPFYSLINSNLAYYAKLANIFAYWPTNLDAWAAISPANFSLQGTGITNIVAGSNTTVSITGQTATISATGGGASVPGVLTNNQPTVSLPNNTGASGQAMTLAGGSQTGGQPAGSVTISGGTGSSGSPSGNVTIQGGAGNAVGTVVIKNGFSDNATFDANNNLDTFNLPVLVNGSVTATTFIGDGSQLTGISGGGGGVGVGAGTNIIAVTNSGTVIISAAVSHAEVQAATNQLANGAYTTTNHFDGAGQGAASALAATNHLGSAAFSNTNSFDLQGQAKDATNHLANGAFTSTNNFDGAGQGAASALAATNNLNATAFTGNATSAGYAFNAPPVMPVNTAAVPVLLANNAGALTSDNVTVSNLNDMYIPGKAVVGGNTIGSAAFTSSSSYDAAGAAQAATNNLQIPAPRVTGNIVTNSTWLNVLGFGAVGDGVTDNLSAISNAMAQASDCATIFFPPGKYFISTNLVISKRLHFLGTGVGRFVTAFTNTVYPASTLVWTNLANSLFTVVTNYDTFDSLGILWTNSLTPTDGAAITVTTNADGVSGEIKVDIRNCLIDGGYRCVDYQGSESWMMEDTELIRWWMDGLRINNLANSDFGGWTIANCVLGAITHKSRCAIRWEGSGGGNIINTCMGAFNWAPYNDPGGYTNGIWLHPLGNLQTSGMRITGSLVDNYMWNGIYSDAGTIGFPGLNIAGHQSESFVTGANVPICLTGGVGNNGTIAGLVVMPGGLGANTSPIIFTNMTKMMVTAVSSASTAPDYLSVGGNLINVIQTPMVVSNFNGNFNYALKVNNAANDQSFGANAFGAFCPNISAGKHVGFDLGVGGSNGLAGATFTYDYNNATLMSANTFSCFFFAQAVPALTVGQSGAIMPGTITATNGHILPVITIGPAVTNGVSALWNSNGVTFLRWSPIGAVTNADKQIAP